MILAYTKSVSQSTRYTMKKFPELLIKTRKIPTYKD